MIAVQALQQMDYRTALTKQRRLFQSMLDDKKQGKRPRQYLLLCEHQPVYTLGKRADSNNILLAKEHLQADVVRIERGGDVTFHGPGQITGYPLLDLEHFSIGLKEYIYRLEQVVIDLLKQYNLDGQRLEGASGVWLDAGKPGLERKICALGVKASRYVTMHGFALNVNTDLDWFTKINPCGFTDKKVTSLERELGKALDIQQVAEQFLDHFQLHFPGTYVGEE